MNKRGAVAITAALAAIAAFALTALPSVAQVPPPPIASESLTARAIFPNDVDMKIKLKAAHGGTQVVHVRDPSRTAVLRYTVQPGAQFPWHTHQGPVVVNIVSGALTYVDAETCAEQTYTVGEAFVDPGHGHVHSAFNPTGSPTVFIATFFEAPAQGSLLIPAEPADC
jgi:quercetin dioxygenase-like cupin family protein